MKVVYTDEALHDLDDILKYIAANFPAAYQGFASRLQAVGLRIGQLPQSARPVTERSGVRAFGLFPYFAIPTKSFIV
jgi:plasmid stabilization system protein ParE